MPYANAKPGPTLTGGAPARVQMPRRESATYVCDILCRRWFITCVAQTPRSN